MLLSSPHENAKGVKVKRIGSQWHCGNCGAHVASTFGFASEGVDCPNCGKHVRCDFDPDLASERLERLAAWLDEMSVQHDSVVMVRASKMILDVLFDVQNMEKDANAMGTMFFGEKADHLEGHVEQDPWGGAA